MIVEERGEQVKDGRNDTVLNKSRMEETKSVVLFAKEILYSYEYVSKLSANLRSYSSYARILRQ
ncbi:hypothetical protein H5410_054422 [Solanum commersonii]|uniref:Uncharacterized protein n=1 Tax=Solanum commersonii TaxID=4109 RepID=A0A9J5WH50_SOLCO|nr:hypothetical protein H5410_054422 [Solanum commersonii]